MRGELWVQQGDLYRVHYNVHFWEFIVAAGVFPRRYKGTLVLTAIFQHQGSQRGLHKKLKLQLHKKNWTAKPQNKTAAVQTQFKY